MAAKVLYFVLLAPFLPFSVVTQLTNGSVPLGASLTATYNITPWLSPSGDFAFGFQQRQEKDSFVLSIWYDKIPEKTIIWYPETNPMVSRGSQVRLTEGRGLVLSDPQGRELWSTSSGAISDLAYGFMNDTGNFVIHGNNSRKIWESFNFPADTILPNQVMARGGVIYSKRSETNFSRGRFQLRLLEDGNLVLNTRDIPSNFAYKAYYSSDTNDSSNSQNSGERLIFDAGGYMYISRRNGQRFDLTPREALPSGDYYHRATIGVDGVFSQYYRRKLSTGNASWEVLWFEPENICNYGGLEGSGACGFNNICALLNTRPKCECPRGFSLLDPSDPNGDCKPDFYPRCDENASSYGYDRFDFIELTDVDWPSADYVHMRPTSEQNCRTSCVEDCFCAAAVYGGNECWKKKLPLSNGRRDNSINKKVFLKFLKDDRPLQDPPIFSGRKKDRKTLIVVGASLLGTSMFVNVVLIVVICLGFFLIYKKAVRNVHPSSKLVETNLRHFTTREATNGFKDELGRGAFGIVYKGAIGTSIVAVKKLDKVVRDGEKEFKTEVHAIARTHHRNLVQLLGYCDDGDQRLLIYEHVSNGTLADFLFGDTRPDWKWRSRIAVGIAKGSRTFTKSVARRSSIATLSPEHTSRRLLRSQDCGFGVERVPDRGTKGYVAPEWFRNKSVTVKVDVFSFGVVLLEIVSCRKSVVFESGKEDVSILTDWAWDCYRDGRVDAFVENNLEVLDDYKKLTTFVMAGLWCVQENPLLRPSMRNVVQMLDGVVEVPEPPCPFPLSVS
ncbi:LOW QUALITY PROTEIN: hypothetical protein OSB04_013999 [Centaurea solstitialis]|uniref:Receptor-like serine/threonine-protein kinase n=1 Tax=Centaurea solstitialis TaxID=347529 RepID=A0AA38WNW6_9ASTR|nr:LOW QUALITY PROTEIN: hypothetical protein OSB04_013999 [Centaurea solstitialis]